MTSRQQGSGANGTSDGRGWRMLRPHVDELVRRLSMESDGVDVHVRQSEAVTLTWHRMAFGFRDLRGRDV